MELHALYALNLFSKPPRYEVVGNESFDNTRMCRCILCKDTLDISGGSQERPSNDFSPICDMSHIPLLWQAKRSQFRFDVFDIEGWLFFTFRLPHSKLHGCFREGQFSFFIEIMEYKFTYGRVFNRFYRFEQLNGCSLPIVALLVHIPEK